MADKPQRGTLLGIPCNFECPGAGRLLSSYWQPGKGILVEKPFGIGYTLNLVSWRSWVVLSVVGGLLWNERQKAEETENEAEADNGPVEIIVDRGDATDTDNLFTSARGGLDMLQYVTTNAREARKALSYLDDDMTQFDLDYIEVQVSDLSPTAVHGARGAHRYADKPVPMDNAGLFIDGLEGFPDPYSSYVEDTFGVKAVYRPAAAELDEPRRVSSRCVLTCYDSEPFEMSPNPIDRDDRTMVAARSVEQDVEETETLPVKLLAGGVNGHIVPPCGEGSFGYDPIFEHDGVISAEMSAEEKNGISRRGRALAKFLTWYVER